MPNFLAAITSRASAALTALVIVTGASTANASDEGVANYASYLDKNYAMDTAAAIEQRLSSKVLIQQVEVNGKSWLRLQSQVMSAVEAKSLVVRATAAGFAAWYQSAPGQSAPATSGTPPTVASARALISQPEAPPTSVPVVTPSVAESANAKLVAMLPEGPLLGEIYPPRVEANANSPR